MFLCAPVDAEIGWLVITRSLVATSEALLNDALNYKVAVLKTLCFVCACSCYRKLMLVKTI
jgi:hypothetical protein